MAFRGFNCKRCGAEVYTDYHQDSKYLVELVAKNGFCFHIRLCDRCNKELCDEIDKFLNKDKDKTID